MELQSTSELVQKLKSEEHILPKCLYQYLESPEDVLKCLKDAKITEVVAFVSACKFSFSLGLTFI